MVMRRPEESDISYFDSALATLMMEQDENDVDEGADRSSMHYVTPFGRIIVDFILEKNSEDELKFSSMHAVECHTADSVTSSNDRSVQFITGNSNHTIDQLSQVFERFLNQSGENIDRKWQFTYIDPSLGRMNMTVIKESLQHLSLVITSSQIVDVNLKKLFQQLHSRLLQKGWRSQISQASNECTQNIIVDSFK